MRKSKKGSSEYIWVEDRRLGILLVVTVIGMVACACAVWALDQQQGGPHNLRQSTRDAQCRDGLPLAQKIMGDELPALQSKYINELRNRPRARMHFSYRLLLHFHAVLGGPQYKVNRTWQAKLAPPQFWVGKDVTLCIDGKSYTADIQTRGTDARKCSCCIPSLKRPNVHVFLFRPLV
jgi:hypothetical protein